MDGCKSTKNVPFGKLAVLVCILSIAVELSYSQFCKMENVMRDSRGRWYDRLVLQCTNINVFPLQMGPSMNDVDKKQIIQIAFYKSQLHQVPALVFHEFSGLSRLYLNDSGIHSLEMGVFLGLTQLTELYLEKNSIQSIEKGVFSHLNKLEILDISNNVIVAINRDAIQGMLSLESFFLNNNAIKVIGNATFASFHQLKQIDLSQNQLERLNSSIFLDLKNLTYLNISNNRIESLPLGLFRDLAKLRTLDVSNNRVMSVPLGSLSGLESLISFNLSNNQIIALNGEALNSIPDLRLLNIDSNKLSYLEPTELSAFLPKLKIIHMNGNKWHCSLLLNILKAFRRSGINVATGSTFLTENVNGIQCSRDYNHSDHTPNSNSIDQMIQKDTHSFQFDTDFKTILESFYQRFQGNVQQIIAKSFDSTNTLQKIVDVNEKGTEALKALLTNSKSLESILLRQEKLLVESNGFISSLTFPSNASQTTLAIPKINDSSTKGLNNIQDILLNMTKLLKTISQKDLLFKFADGAEKDLLITKEILEEISNHSKLIHNLLQDANLNNQQNQRSQQRSCDLQNGHSTVYNSSMSDTLAKLLMQTEHFHNYMVNLSRNITLLQNTLHRFEMLKSEQDTNFMFPEYLRASKTSLNIPNMESLRTSVIICFSVMAVFMFLILITLYLRSSKDLPVFRWLNRPWVHPRQPDTSQVDLMANSERTLNSQI